jgi:hypothetical protein
LWLSDKNFTTSGDIDQRCPASVKHTLDDALYCSERYFSGDAGTFEIPVATNDLIQVVINFAELSYNPTNKRLFHIIVEGQPVIHNYDIYAAAGGFYAASHVFSLTTVTDGFLTIELVPVKGDAKINAMEVHHHSAARSKDSFTVPEEDPVELDMEPVDEDVAKPTSAPVFSSIDPPAISAPTSPVDASSTSATAIVSDPLLASDDLPAGTPDGEPILINSGGLDVTTSDNLVWRSDFSHPECIVGSASALDLCPPNVTGSAALYCSERWFDGPGGYEIPVGSSNSTAPSIQ